MSGSGVAATRPRHALVGHARRLAGHRIRSSRLRRRVLLAQQRQQRIGRIDRIQIEHQPMLVRPDGLEREHLRLDVFLQLDHEPHDLRTVLADAHERDVRIVGLDLADDFLQLRREVHVLDVDHQPHRARVAHHEVRELQRRVVFERQARVILGGPDAHREQRGAAGDFERSEREDERSAGGVDQLPAVRAWNSSSALVRHAWPSWLAAVMDAARPVAVHAQRDRQVRGWQPGSGALGPLDRTDPAGSETDPGSRMTRTRSDRQTDRNQSGRSLSSKPNKVQAART